MDFYRKSAGVSTGSSEVLQEVQNFYRKFCYSYRKLKNQVSSSGRVRKGCMDGQGDSRGGCDGSAAER